ncbi:transposase, partial [Serratia ficaria]|uniref:transposase n=1 Tax=Serratia ficaria TaxID=61651 RepID=UPI0021CAC058
MFRQEAIDNQKMKWRGRALLLPGIPFWLTAGLCLFFLIAFLTFVIPPCQDSCRLELKNFRGPETTKMNTYSPERKAALIARMMPPHNQSVVQLARSEGIPANTLYAWRTQAGVGAAESL